MSGPSCLQTIETELKSFALRAFRIDFDETGEFVGVWHRKRTAQPYLRRLALDQLICDDQPANWTQDRTVIDTDEVERAWTADGIARVELRHSFAAGWRTRLAVTNLAATSWTGRLGLVLEPGEGFRGWGMSIAGESTYAVLPWSAELPILAARSVHSPIDAVWASGLQVGPIVVAPGDRFVTAWDWWSTPHPGGLADRLPADVPRQLTVEVGDEIWLRADPDTAVVAPPDVDTVDDQDHRALSTAEPGRRRVEVRSARGSSVLDLSWVPSPADFLAATAERLLAEPAGPNGVVRLPDLVSALVVQRAVRGPGLQAVAEAADALDLFSARMVETTDDPALPVIFLSGEYDRTGDPDQLGEAVGRLAAARAVTPGLGSAIVRAGLAAVATGRRPTLPAVRPTTEDYPSFSDAAAALELQLAIASPPRLLNDGWIRNLLHRLGVELGAGLPGRGSSQLPVDDLGHCLAVLHLVPDSLYPSWTSWFAVPVPELVDALALELVDRLERRPVSMGHAWLAVTS